LARRWDITSAFGAFLDPVADKLMVSTSLILLAGRYGAQVAIPACIILAREIAVSALREWMAQRGQRNLVKVGMQGKVKTALTMVALTVLLFVPTNGVGLLTKLLTPGLVMLYMSTLVTVTSGSVYFIAAAPLMKK
jgi:CDP-diacylglycerol--glycerol-3-phosphate 3-phosphatidyltransferase